MKNLVLGPIPENFDKTTHIPIDIRCFLNREHLFSDVEKISFVTPFKNEVRHELVDKLNKFAITLCKRHGIRLNKIHNKKYSQKFWQLALGPWLIHLLYTTWSNYCDLEEIFKKHKKKELICTSLTPPKNWNIETTENYFSNFMLNPVFNWWTYSVFLSSFVNKSQIRIEKFSDWEAISSTYAKNNTVDKSIISFYKQKINNSLRCKNVDGIHFFGRLCLSLFLKYCPKSQSTISPSIDTPLNTQIEDFPPNFLKGLDLIIKKSIPNSLSKNFIDYAKIFEKQKYYPGKFNIVQTELYCPEKNNFTIAFAKENDEKILCVQHGAGYGELLTYPYLQFIDYGQDGFISWGWRNHGNYKVKTLPLPAPKLSRIINKHSQCNENIILVSHEANATRNGSLFSIPSKNDIFTYRKEKVLFLNKLEKNLLPNVKFKPYVSNSFLCDKTFLNKTFPDIPVIDTDFHDHLLTSKITIIDHPGTTLILALVANVPTIAFWDPKLWIFTDFGRETHKNLLNAEVLFHSPEQAANQVNSVFPNVSHWWNSEKVQHARKEWIKHYGYTKKHWVLDWMKEIKKIN
ncbi:hypothetical protein HOG98_00550 [bacterium]|nr:hypothetical protein [bacterium]